VSTRPRRLAALLTGVALVLGAVACGGSDEDAKPQTDSPLETITPGVLTVGTELPAPTFWNGADYRSVDGGFEYELAREIARRLGDLDVKVVKCPFIAINAGAPCDCDIDFSQIGITEARKRHWDFTVPYFDADFGVMVKTSANVTESKVRSLEYGIQAETTAFDFVEDRIRPTEPVEPYDTTVAMFDAFNTGEVDAIVFDLPILLSAMSEGQVADAKIVGQYRTGERYGGILPKGSPNTDIVNRTLREMHDDGTVERLQQDYFGVATRRAAPFWDPPSG
jgi:polar amino acid transport system substrate-binding protein